MALEALSTFGELGEAEQALVAEWQGRTPAEIEGTATEAKLFVRAELIELLVLGTGDLAGLREIRLVGRTIVGPLNLRGIQSLEQLWLEDCVLESLDIVDASFGNIELSGSSFANGIDGRRVKIRDGLILKRITAEATIHLEAAEIGDTLLLNAADLFVEGSRAIQAPGLKCRNFLVSGGHFSGGVDLREAAIADQLDFDNITIKTTGRVGLSLAKASVGGTLSLAKDFKLCGAGLVLRNGTFANLSIADASIEVPSGHAIDADRATFRGVFGFETSTIVGQTNFSRAVINGDALFKSGRFQKAAVNPALKTDQPAAPGQAPGTENDRIPDALSFENATITGHLVFEPEVSTVGTLRLTNATVNGYVEVNAALDGAGQDALEAQFAKVTLMVSLKWRTQPLGAVSFRNAVIENDLLLQGVVAAGEAPPVNLDRAIVRGSVVISSGQFGQIRLAYVQVGGTLQFDGGQFEAKKGHAIKLRGARIAGDVNFGGAVKVKGGIDLANAWIGGGLALGPSAKTRQRVSIRNAEAETAAIGAFRLKVDRDIILGPGLIVWGGVDLRWAMIGANLVVLGAKFLNWTKLESAAAFDAGFAVVNADFAWQKVCVKHGSIMLTGLRCSGLNDDGASWKPGTYWLDGFHYERFTADLPLADANLAPEVLTQLRIRSPVSADRRSDWIKDQIPARSADGLRPQPWLRAAEVLRAMGYAKYARDISIALERQRLTESRNAGEGWLRRGFRHVYGHMMRFGYSPAPLFCYTIAIALAGTALFGWAAAPTWLPPSLKTEGPALIKPATVPKICEPANPLSSCQAWQNLRDDFNPLVYSVDNMLPVISFKYASRYEPATHDDAGRRLSLGYAIRAWIWFQNVWGWFAGAMIATAIGSLIKRS